MRSKGGKQKLVISSADILGKEKRTRGEKSSMNVSRNYANRLREADESYDIKDFTCSRIYYIVVYSILKKKSGAWPYCLKWGHSDMLRKKSYIIL